MTEKEKIEVLRTLRVIARDASDDIRREALRLVRLLSHKSIIEDSAVGENFLKGTYKIILKKYPVLWDSWSHSNKENKIQAIKAVRDAGNIVSGKTLSLRESKDLVEAPEPRVIFDNLDWDKADQVERCLQDYGCEVECIKTI